MSNSTPATSSLAGTPLHVARLSLQGEGAWPDLQVDGISPQLNVFYAPPHAGKSSVAHLVGQLLYGKSQSSWRRQFGQTVSAADGSLELKTTKGMYHLRRQRDSQQRHEEENARLTISSERGDPVDGQTIRNLLSGLTPEQASKVFSVDFAESPRVAWLLSDENAQGFSGSRTAETTLRNGFSASCQTVDEANFVNRIDRQRVDELVKRRDAIAGEIEQQMSVRRRESEVLDREVAEVDEALTSRREKAQQTQAQLRGIETEIAELETHLRYFSLDCYSKEPGKRIDIDQQQRELEELDREISACRRSLADLQQRENHLRTELAQWSPDGTADSVTCLADGRATLSTLEQLLDDLDAEVSLLARANEPGRCIGHDSHVKLSPVATLLRQQVYTLCGQLTEQERVLRRQELTAESRQITRVQAELGDRLDLLLARRESLIQRTQLVGQPARLVPQPPAADHCHCEHHGTFVQQADSMILSRADRNRRETEARHRLSDLRQQRTRLADELLALRNAIEQLEQRWEHLQRQRGGLIGGASIESRQAELEHLESIIQQALEANSTHAPAPLAGYWRASDILAQLTDGQLVQIRLDRHHHQANVVDRQGKPRAIESLTNAEHDQLYLALTLALVSSYSRRGIHLPLVLDEPFLQQDAAQTLVMAGVLEEFARTGHQLLVFTEDREVRRRFAKLSATLFDLEELRHTRTAPEQPTVEAPPIMTAEQSPIVQTTNTRIIRETFDGESTPVLRLATVEGTADQEDVFYLTETSTFHDFPVLGAETDALFARLNIHSIGDLLTATAEEIAQQLDRPGITADTVRLWQIHMGLMCHVPHLTLDDAQVFAAVRIESPADLFDADLDQLLRAINGFLNSDRGRRFHRAEGRYNRSRLGEWRSGARRYRDRWQRASQRYSGWRSRRSSPRVASSTRNGQKKSRRRESVPRPASARKRRFYLSREQDVEAAPSIGPKTAKRLARVGIRTVADLLHADPASTATELDKSYITAETIAAWQHQARLVCQIPELRGYGAQLLVACGLTQPEQIAATRAEELIAQVLACCETKEGQRILRSGDAPAREKIAAWVELAQHSRPLEAA